MKKAIFLISLFLVTICCVFNAHNTFAIAPQKPIKVVGLADGQIVGSASLFGKGQNFIANPNLIVKFEGFEDYQIDLEGGYSPNIWTFDFGGEDKFLFYSSQTGGSGGYGNYQVYHLKTDGYNLVYDDKQNSKETTFDAKFMPNGFMELTNNHTQNNLTVDVSYMDKTYYNMIFDENGNVKENQPYVNNISFVSPSLNSASGLFRLVTYRSVAAVAEVNRLGYIVQTLDFDGKAFVPTFTEFAIGL